jgi:hypothetical protein
MAKTKAKYWKLLVKSQSFPETQYELDKNEFIVGRIRSSDLSIRNESVSRQHAKFSSAEGKIYIEDLKSANGVRLNGVKLAANVATEIKVGDVIWIGSDLNSIKIVSTEFHEDQPHVPPPISQIPVPSPEAKKPPNPPPPSRSERTNIDAIIQKQKIQDEINSLKNELIQNQQQLQNAKQEEQTWRELQKVERAQHESYLNGLAQKKINLEESYEQNKASLKAQEDTIQSLLTRIKEQEDLIRLRNLENEKIVLVKEDLIKSIDTLKSEDAQLKPRILAEEKESQSQIQQLKQQIDVALGNKISLESSINEASEELRLLLSQKSKSGAEFEEQKIKRAIECASREAEFKLAETRAQTSIEECKSATVRAQRELDQSERELEKLKNRITDAREEHTRTMRSGQEEHQKLAENVRKLKEEIQELKTQTLHAQAELSNIEQVARVAEAEKKQKLDSLQTVKQEHDVEMIRINEKKKAIDEELSIFESSLQAKRDAFQTELNENRKQAEANFAKEKAAYLAESKREISLDLLKQKTQFDAEMLQLKQQFDVQNEQQRRLLEAEHQRARDQHEKGLKADLEEFRNQKSRESAIREKLFIEGILGSFFASAKIAKFHIPADVLSDFEFRVRTNLNSLYLASDENSLKALEQEQPWIKSGKRVSLVERFQRPALFASMGLSLVLGLSFLSGRGSLRDWATAQNEIVRKNQESKLLRSRLEANRPYETQRDSRYRSNYTENLLFLDSYIELVMEERYRKEWIVKVNQFFTKEIPSGDRRAPQYLATEATLLAELIKLRKTINAKNPDPGIQRMHEMELQYLDKLEDIAGTPKQWKRIQELERSFFFDYLGNQSNSMRSPASDTD